MKRFALSSLLCASAVSFSGVAAASERAFAFTQESHVHGPGESVVEPWSTLSVGRERYYSRLDGRLKLEHGLLPRLQLALFWNFQTVTEDVVADDLTGEIARVTDSSLASASLELKYQFTDPELDALGSAIHVETTFGPSESELEADLIVDRRSGSWTAAANVSLGYELAPVRDRDGSRLATSFELEALVGLAYELRPGFGLGLELRAPFNVTDGRAALLGGPALSFEDQSFWAVLGVQPQLVAFSGQSPDSTLDLAERERVVVRLLAGFLL